MATGMISNYSNKRAVSS